MTLPTFTIDDILSWNPCEEYNRVKLASVFGEGAFSLFDVLNAPIDIQDRLWVIVRTETLGSEGLEAVDAWVTARFDEIPATTLDGQNCKNNWPRPDEFQRASTLSALLEHETGSDTQFITEIRAVLEGL